MINLPNKRLCLLLSFIFLIGEQSFALDNSSKYQAHFRMGMLQGTYSGSGVDSRTFSVPTTTDLELEIFTSTNESFNVRAIMAMELENNRVNYTYAGMGRTYYLFSRGRLDHRTERLVSIQTRPKHRWYWGYNVGIAQVLAIPFGLVLATYSTTLDATVNGGYIYQVSDNMGFETRFGMGMGYGFSTVTVTGITTRFLIGITYYM